MTPSAADSTATSLALAPAVVHGRAACTELLRSVLCNLGAETAATVADPAAQPGWRAPSEILLADTCFADWPLDEPAVLHSLSQWLRPAGRRLRLISVDFDALTLAAPRFARWRRDWTHRIEVCRPIDGHLPATMRLLLAGPLALFWLDAPAACLQKLTDPRQIAAIRAQSADFLQRCESAWPCTTLGL